MKGGMQLVMLGSRRRDCSDLVIHGKDLESMKSSQGSIRDITSMSGVMYVSDSACFAENDQDEKVRESRRNL